jgi:hypothetical protein
MQKPPTKQQITSPLKTRQRQGKTRCGKAKSTARPDQDTMNQLKTTVGQESRVQNRLFREKTRQVVSKTDTSERRHVVDKLKLVVALHNRASDFQHCMSISAKHIQYDKCQRKQTPQPLNDSVFLNMSGRDE